MKKIGRYRVLGLLGRGGMGAVYKVALPVIGRAVALKLLSPTPFLVSLLGDKAIERAFMAEARALAAVSHPNVASVWDVGRAGGRPYFIMEYVCRDLGQVIGEAHEVERPTRRLPLPRAAGYALQTLAGLARLHHAGIVHRDVKPFNLLLDGEDRVRIADFGLSRVRGEAPARVAGLKVGSPFYAAPEQEADPDRAGPGADLYSVAVSLHRMATDLLPRFPLAGDALPSRLSRDMDGEWDRFFLRALDPDPGARHPDAQSMARELASLLERWRRRVAGVCSMDPGMDGKWARDPAVAAPEGPPEASARPRSEPLRTGVKGALERLGLDELGRPACRRAAGLESMGEVVADRAAGLLWQAGGSPWPLTMAEAARYVDGLNEAGFAGLRGWRLPTVEELSTILDPPPELEGHCLSPLFDPAQRLLWSADRRAHTQGWYADLETGAFCHADLACARHARAVRALEGSPRP